MINSAERNLTAHKYLKLICIIYFACWITDLTFSMMPAFFHAFGLDNLSYIYNSLRYGGFICALLFLIINQKIFSPFSIITSLLFIFIPLFGIYRWELNQYSVKHLISLILPIIGISFGYYAVKLFPDIIYSATKVIQKSIFVIFPMVIIYYSLYLSGYITYLGVSNSFPLTLSSSIYFNSIPGICISLIGLGLAGKRSDLISAILILLVAKVKSLKDLFLYIFVLISAWILSFYLLPDLFKRFELIFNSIKSNEFDELNISSSGRIDDIILITSLFEDYYDYIFGLGLGYSYFLDMDYVVYYSHFTPLSYYALGGVFNLIIFLMYIYKTFNAAINVKNNLFKFFSLYYVLISFIGGAVLFTSIYGWFCFGVLFGQRELNGNLKK
jgi:hypothetical protein